MVVDRSHPSGSASLIVPGPPSQAVRTGDSDRGVASSGSATTDASADGAHASGSGSASPARPGIRRRRSSSFSVTLRGYCALQTLVGCLPRPASETPLRAPKSAGSCQWQLQWQPPACLPVRAHVDMLRHLKPSL